MIARNEDWDNWDRIEDEFRFWSFCVYFRKSFATERDPLLRFVKSVLASARPIEDREAVLDWHRHWRRRRKVKT